MGTLRFTLAFLVLLSHTFLSWPYYFNPGMLALPCFYIISGYAMTAVVRSHYPKISHFRWFYLDRVLRLYPQYLLFISFSVLMIALLGLRDPFFGNLEPEKAALPIYDIFLNVLMIPNNILFFRSHFGELALIIPPTWSLGLEMTFYIIFPFILLKNFRNMVFVVSVSIFLLSQFSVINPMVWGYTLLPGTLFYFLLGSLLFDHSESENKKMVFIASGAGAVILMITLLTENFKVAANFEMITALIVGPMLVFMTKNFRHKFDDFLGNISYGLFLVHYIVIKITHHFYPNTDGFILLGVVTGVSVIFATIGYEIVEKPAVVFRRQLRKY